MDYMGLSRFMETIWKRWLKMKKWLTNPLLQVPEISWEYWSGRADLNGRPPAPKAGALTRLRYAPIFQIPITKFQALNKFQLPNVVSQKKLCAFCHSGLDPESNVFGLDS